MEIDLINDAWDDPWNSRQYSTEEKRSSNQEPVIFNYIVELQKLVGRIFEQLGRISANDHAAIEKMQTTYMNSSLKSSRLQVESGAVSKNLSCVAFVIFFGRLGFPNSDDKAILEVISNHVPTAGSVVTARLQAGVNEENSKAQLEMEKYRAKMNAKSSGEGSKQEFLTLLQMFSDMVRTTSRIG